mgnify:CR=1 FL=1
MTSKVKYIEEFELAKNTAIYVGKFLESQEHKVIHSSDQKDIKLELDRTSEEKIINPQGEQLGLFLETAHPAIKQLEAIEPDNLSPRQAMETLYHLKNLIKKPSK